MVSVAIAEPTFREWADSWMELARFTGTLLPEEDERIAKVVALWNEPIPSQWERGRDARLLGHEERHLRYCRRNYRADASRRGEHAIEFELLDPSPAERETLCFGDRLVDGVNAVPLAKDVEGGRSGNVEADMLLLVASQGGYRLLLVEVKEASNHAWFAVVENLRQMKLFAESSAAQSLFREERRPELALPSQLPVTGVVLAPPSFYAARGRKAASVAPAQRLADRMREYVGVDIRLATWEPRKRMIVPLAQEV